MRKIDLIPYKVTTFSATGEAKESDYNVKESLANILFAPGQDLPVRETLKNAQLADKIDANPGVYIILEDADWDRLVKAVNTLKDIRRSDVEFVSRILDAEPYSLKEVK